MLEYASTIWSPTASTTNSVHYRQCKTQHCTLQMAAHLTVDTSIQHMHDETNILPLNTPETVRIENKITHIHYTYKEQTFNDYRYTTHTQYTHQTKHNMYTLYHSHYILGLHI